MFQLQLFFFLLHCDEWDRVVALPRHKFVTGATLLQLTDDVPSGTILAVHLQKCSHLSNEIRVMQIFLHSKTFMIYFPTFTGKIAKP